LDYPRLAAELDAAGFGNATFVAIDREIIGNLLPHMPGATMQYPAGVEPFRRPAGTVVLLWDAQLGENLPLKLMPAVESTVGEFQFRPARLRTFTLHSRNPDGRPVGVRAYALPAKR
ncbi:MAG TPA: hypothetical protein VM529_05295, partial [Gemmata sp.]|nr:hypothetical protein [Gemmata sp.]